MKNTKRENVLTTLTLALFEAGAAPSEALLAEVVRRLKVYGHFTSEDEFIGAARIAAHQAVGAQQEMAESSVNTRLFACSGPARGDSHKTDSAPSKPARPGRTLRVVKSGKPS